VSSLEKYFTSLKGMLGVALDLLMVAEQLSQVDPHFDGFTPDIELDDILGRYENTAKTTLTPTYNGEKYGIRSVHNRLITLF